MKTKAQKDSAELFFIFHIFAAALTMILFFGALLMEEKDPVPSAFSDEWYSDEAMTQKVDLKHPVLHDRKAVFYAVVPKDIKIGDSLWFKDKNGYFTVTVDGEVRARKQPSGNSLLYGKTPGTDWICVPLGQEDASKIIRIDFSTNYDDKSSYIDEVYIGATQTNMRYSLADRLFGTVLCILMMVFGLVLIAIHIIFSFRLKIKSNELLYLGSGAFFISLWSLSELRILQMFTEKNAGIFHNLTCMAMMLIAMPLLLYFKPELDKQNKYIAIVLTALSGINFVVCSILHFTGLYDFHETLTFTHVTIIVGAGGVLYANALRIFNNKEKTERVIPEAVCMVLVMVAGILDILRYRGGGIKDASFFTRIGLFLYIVVLGTRSLMYVMELAEKGMKADIIARLAYEDGLTGLGNRTAYNERMEDMQGKAASIFAFDINYLKYVNDHLGHDAGDELIKSSAELIESVFGEICKCYRIGGDEFVCLAEGIVDVGKYEEEFYRRMQVFNKMELLKFPLVIALGYETCGEGGDINAALKTADQRMYVKKKEMKQGDNGMFDREGT